MKKLSKKERKQIFGLFLNSNQLRFSDIEKKLDIRSNMVSYHIEQMIKEGLLKKHEGYYRLTDEAEKFIPIFSLIADQELSPVPAVLVAIMNEDRILLIKRDKRPYKDYWAMIGGKMLLDETFEKTSLRLTHSKAGIDGKFISINSVMQEHVSKDEITKHSFILFFCKVLTDKEFKPSESGELRWFNLSELPEELVPSDRWLIENKLDSKADIANAAMSENKGRLFDFRLR